MKTTLIGFTLTPEGSKFRLPTRPKLMLVTPEMASDWLSYRNHPKNRPLSKSVAARYQGDMEAGRWQEGTPEGFIFDTDGYTISGQHRMKAMANANVSLMVWIFPDQPREIFEVVDQGYKRTAAHLLRVPYATNLGAAARHLAALADGDRWGMPRYSKIATPEIVSTFHQWPELEWFIKDIHGASLEAFVPIGPHAAVLAMAARTEYRERIPAWLAGVRTGEDLHGHDPRLKLRKRFIGGISATSKDRRDYSYAMIAKAWNAYAMNEELTVLRHARTELLPEVVGFSFTREVKAA